MSFLLLYWKYIVAAVLVAALVGYYNVHVNGLISDAEKAAVTSNNKTWQAAEQKAIKAAEDAARATEQAHAKALGAIKTGYDKELSNAKTQRERDIAAARSGALRLRDTAASASACNDSKASAAAAGSDGPKGADLSGAASEFLLSLANEADALVAQLTACQSVITSDRKTQ